MNSATDVLDIGFDEIEHSDPDGIADPAKVLNIFPLYWTNYPDTSAHSFHVHDIRGYGLNQPTMQQWKPA